MFDKDGYSFLLWLWKETERRGWSMAEMSRRMGLSQSTVTRWKKGGRTPHKYIQETIRRKMKEETDG